MTPSIPRRLRLELVAVVVLLSGAAVAGRALLARVVPPAAADRWLLVAGAVIAYEVGFLGYHLGANRPASGSIRPTLGVATHVTLVRGGLLAGVAGFLVVPPAASAVAWVPGLWYAAGAALDFVDGAVARGIGVRTELGGKLDLAFDTLGFLVAPLVGVAWGRLPVWYLSISAARYVYRGGLRWHERRGGSIGDLPESRVRRPLAALQMAFIAGALMPVAPVGVVHVLAAIVATPSLVVFARDYLAVTGRIDRESER